MDVNNPSTTVRQGSGFQIRHISLPFWNGDPKVVIAIDIGDTHSTVAFSYLTMRNEPKVHRVTNWPGQTYSDSSRVPSLIWYDSDGKPRSFGADAEARNTQKEAEECGWELACNFKLHLHPLNMANHNLVLGPLPPMVSLFQIYSDFLRYLLEHTQRYFEESTIDGLKPWQECYQDMEVVIGHPSGYGIREQKFLRSAAVAAGFVASDRAEDHVRFVTEAEASTYFRIDYDKLEDRLPVGSNFIVCDAGGSTVDTTLYTVRSIDPTLQLEEVRTSSIHAGGRFVDKMAESHLRQLFEKAGLQSNEINDFAIAGTESFAAWAKKAFDGVTGGWDITISDTACDIPALGVQHGRLRLTSSTVQSFFDRCVDEIIASVNLQVSSAPVSNIFLIGGFGSSQYLNNQLQAQLEPSGAKVTVLGGIGTKLTVDGAIKWYCGRNQISKFACWFAYGTEVDVPFDQTNVEHSGRAQVNKPSGVYVRGKWLQLIQEEKCMNRDTIVRQTHTREYSRPDIDLGTLDEGVYGCFRARDDPPSWLRAKSGEELERFEKFCSVTADLSGMRKVLQPRINAQGVKYWTLNFNVCFLFGGTELDAFIEWVEEDKIRTMPAKLTMHVVSWFV